MSMIETTDTERRIAERVDPRVAGELAISTAAGGLAFRDMSQVMEFAKMMSISSVAIPKHLRGNPGACLGVCIQAFEWRLSPFAVANKSYSVNDRLAYESQLIQAVILQRAPIKGRFKVEFFGEGNTRVCKIWATLNNDEVKDYTSPKVGDIPIKNSPLWKGDPDQQLYYYSARALCRRHFPDIMLGIYTGDEMEYAPRMGADHAKDITPRKTIDEKLDAIAQDSGEPSRETPPHDPVTGEIAGADAAKGVDQPGISDEAHDTALRALMDTADEKARGGPAIFKKWRDRLSAPDYTLIEPFLDSYYERAMYAGESK